MYNEFMFPVESKYLPALKVNKQPYIRVTYRTVNGTEPEITEIGFHPVIAIHITNLSGFFAELEAAAKEHYNDMIPKPELNDLERQEQQYL